MPSAHPIALTLGEALAWRASLWHLPEVDMGPLEGDWSTLAQIVADDAAIEDWLAYQASYSPSLDRRGRAAYLMTDYTRLLSGAVVPLFLGGVHPFDLRPSEIALGYRSKPLIHEGREIEERRYRIRFVRNGREDRVGIVGPVAARREDFRLQLEANLIGLVERLNAVTRLSRGALWRLAGDAFAVAFLDAGRLIGAEAAAMDHALAILKVAGSPFNNRQLAFFEVAIDDPERPGTEILRRTFRARGGCCRFYTVEGGSLCSTCVLKDRQKRDEDIADAMRRFLARGCAGPDH